MVKIKWNEEALADMDEIAAFIAADSVTYALIQTEKIFDRAEILIRNPRAGKVVPELNDKNVRQLVEGNYRIIYEIKSPGSVEVLCIIHGMRLLEKHTAFKNRK